MLPGHRVTGDRRERGRGAGRRYLFVAIDGSRLGFARLYPDERADSALAFLEACERFCAGYEIRIERVLTDDGTCFKRRWQLASGQRRIAVRKMRPYWPQTNGKAERFIRTLPERWAMPTATGTSGSEPPPFQFFSDVRATGPPAGR